MINQVNTTQCFSNHDFHTTEEQIVVFLKRKMYIYRKSYNGFSKINVSLLVEKTTLSTAGLTPYLFFHSLVLPLATSDVGIPVDPACSSGL